jgi:hypothetical protein
MSEIVVRYPDQEPKTPNFFLGVGICAALGTTAFLTFGRDIIPEIGFDTENVSSGGGAIEEVYITSPSRQLYTTYQTGWARVEDDSPGFIRNPYAQEVAINQIKVMQESQTMRVYERHNDVIGAYVYIAFFDDEGSETNLAPNDIYLRPSAPETCILTTGDEGQLEFEQCTDEDDPNYTGARDFRVDSGGIINSDTSMIEKVAAYADIFRINNYCINGLMLGGVYEGVKTIEEGPDLDLMQERKLGIVRSHIRRSVGRQLNIPLDRVLFKEDFEYFTRESDAEVFEMGDGMDYMVLDNMFRPTKPRSIADLYKRREAIDLDDPIAQEIIELKDDISDVVLPNGLDRDATIKEARSHLINTVCYPGSDISHTEYEQLISNTNKFGAVCIVEGLKYDGTLDLVWAEEQIDSLVTRISERTGRELTNISQKNCGDTSSVLNQLEEPEVANNASAVSSRSREP